MNTPSDAARAAHAAFPCGTHYAYMLDGYPVVCDLPAGHDGSHEDHTHTPPATYVWEAARAILSPETGTAVPGARKPRRVSAQRIPDSAGGGYWTWDVYRFTFGPVAYWGWLPRFDSKGTNNG